MSKYDELSGNVIMTVTPYGMLMSILLETELKIYLNVLSKNNIQFSLDNCMWRTLNKGLGLELLNMSTYCDNIIVVKELGDD